MVIDCLLAMASASRGNGVQRTAEKVTAAKIATAKSRDMPVLKQKPVCLKSTQDLSKFESKEGLD